MLYDPIYRVVLYGQDYEVVIQQHQDFYPYLRCFNCWRYNSSTSRIFASSLEAVKWCVQKGADVNKATKDGRTPMCIASTKGHLGICKYLYANGAATDVQTPTNESVWKNEDDTKGKSPGTIWLRELMEYPSRLHEWYTVTLCELLDLDNDDAEIAAIISGVRPSSVA